MKISENGGAVVYILRCADGTLYTGWTNDIERRVQRHNAGLAAKYTRARRPVELVYTEPAANRRAALRREAAIKRLTRAQKQKLIDKGATTMANIPSYDEAYAFLTQYNEQPFHLLHARTVSGVMRAFAKEQDPVNEEFWAVVGLLHDVDFERWPEEHCVKCVELMREAGYDESLIRACASHGWGMTGTPYEPEHILEKTLFAVDELTGLIGAVARMRPSKSVQDLELKSVRKKFKTPAFAAGCSRETIQKGADMMGMELDELIEKTILAMRTCEE